MLWLLHPKKTLASLSTWPGQRIRVAPFFPPFDFLLTSNAQDVAELVSRKATRSSAAKRMLSVQGINSIVVQDSVVAAKLRDNLAQFLTPLMYERVSQSIVRGLVQSIDAQLLQNEIVTLLPMLRTEFTKTLMEELLGLPVTESFAKQIHQIRLDVFGSDIPLASEVDGLKRLFFFSWLPSGVVTNWLLPKTKKLSDYKSRLATAIFNQAIHMGDQLDPHSRMASLLKMRHDNAITQQQLLGEINGVFDSATPLLVSMAWALLCVATKPEHQDKIAEDEQWAKYCYLEALRLYPPFHILGYSVKPLEGSKCPFKRFQSRFLDRVVHVFGLHRSSLSWMLPDEFIPERFQKGLGSLPKHAFIPFGFGGRACPGRALSLVVGPYVLQQLINRYEFSGDGIVSVKRGSLLCPRDELTLQINRRKIH